jgi:hypothetical protein
MSITLQSYHVKSFANFAEVSEAFFIYLRQYADDGSRFASPSGSEYFTLDGVVYRKSTHWGAKIKNCAWFLDGKTINRKKHTYGACHIDRFVDVCMGDLSTLSDTSRAHYEHCLKNGLYDQ